MLRSVCQYERNINRLISGATTASTLLRSMGIKTKLVENVETPGVGQEAYTWRLALCVVEWQAKSERGQPIKISLDIPEALV
jgi:hypothetical protein